MKKNHKNEEIKRFLLGTITSEEELQKFEEFLMLDDEYFQEILMQEEELIENYADDQLTKQEKRNFENNFLLSKERIQKVKFARLFKRYLNKQKDQKDIKR